MNRSQINSMKMSFPNSISKERFEALKQKMIKKHGLSQHEKTSTTTKVALKDQFLFEVNGISYVDENRYKVEILKRENEKAIKRHGNNPDFRLDEGDFPARRRDFMMNYDYKKTVRYGKSVDEIDWAVFYGSEGTGKSTLAIRLAWEHMKLQPKNRARFFSLVDWLRKLQAEVNWKNEDSGAENISKLPEFVVVDDFDKFIFNNQQKFHLFRLVDTLYRSNRKVIFTMNRSPDELKSLYGGDWEFETMIDRIRERATSVVEIGGTSHRYEINQMNRQRFQNNSPQGRSYGEN